jgi:hypothetical protein
MSNCPKCGNLFKGLDKIINPNYCKECEKSVHPFQSQPVQNEQVEYNEQTNFEGKPPNTKNSTVFSNNGSLNEIVVTDIKMPFLSMVTFMIKWAIASIPAFIILFIMFSVVAAVFGLSG